MSIQELILNVVNDTNQVYNVVNCIIQEYNKQLAFSGIQGVVLMLDLVERYSEVVSNASEFLDSIDDEGLVNKLSMFRHWYYIEEIDAFAPSKFIGYKNITIENYRIGTSIEQGYMDGRDTVKQLKQWFQPINNENYEFYYKRLEEFLSQYDKKPNKMLQLYYKR